MALATGQTTVKNVKETISVIFSKDNHVFAGGVSSALASSVDIDVKAYVGTQEVAYTFGSITPAVPHGLTITPSSVNKKITLDTTTGLVQTSGTYNIEVMVKGTTIIKTFSYMIGFKGDTGDSAVRLALEVPDGTTFSGNNGSPKNVNVKLYFGETDVTVSATTKWYFNGVLNTNLNNLKSIQIYPADVLGNLIIKVIATYNTVDYQDSITFLDLADVYQVNISGKDKIKNSSENVVLTAIAFRGTTQITNGFRCRWTNIGVVPAVVLYEGINTTGTPIERGVVFTLTPSQINDKLDILCELSVDTVEQELELVEANYVPNYDSKAYAAAMSVALSY